jgi:ribosomal protein L2
LVYYADGEKRYILSPKSMKVGDVFIISEKAGNVEFIDLINNITSQEKQKHVGAC